MASFISGSFWEEFVCEKQYGGRYSHIAVSAPNDFVPAVEGGCEQRGKKSMSGGWLIFYGAGYERLLVLEYEGGMHI